MDTMRHLTTRNIPTNVADALEKEKQRRGKSLNRTGIQLLAQSLNLQPGQRRSNGLARLAGTWTAEEFQDFEAATAATRQLDEELWR